MDQPTTDLRVQQFADLAPDVAYALWALRSQVFVVEQAAAYLDLDGRDTEAGTWHVWCADGAGLPVATLRVLDDGASWRVGRVATAEQHRGRGVATAMVREVLERHGDREIVLDAQSHLEHWYAGFGFTVTGDPYADEDGILHVPMRRPAVR
ncbi:GNAT family N-acetyltransferase [Knoellia sp. CPCC 206435]|uniref:GNAT family N-acetyltransferase n=1 Tax=Knoellia terrae TaxID=3404797 RepID=UPI003B43D13E